MSTGATSMVSPHIDISSTFGATLIGSFIATMLYGLTTLQTYLYYAYYPKDPRPTKILVAVIWILDTLETIFMAYNVYFYLVISYFDTTLLGSVHWSLFLSIAFNTVISCITQTFFLVQIHRLCTVKYRWLVVSFIAFLILAHFAFGVESVVYTFIKKDLAELLVSDVRFIATTPFTIFAVASDVMIAGSLCYHLHDNRSKLSKRTNTIISTLIIYAVHRCLLTSVVAAVELILYCTLPTKLWFLAVDFFMGKLYANSLLAALNVRVSIRSANANPTTIKSMHISALKFNSPESSDTLSQELVLNIGDEIESSQRQASVYHHITADEVEKLSSSETDHHHLELCQWSNNDSA